MMKRTQKATEVKRRTISMDDPTHSRALKLAHLDSRSFSNFLCILVDREWERLVADGKIPTEKAA